MADQTVPPPVPDPLAQQRAATEQTADASTFGFHPQDPRKITADTPDYGYGPRWDEATQSYSGAPKGLGFFGPLKHPSGAVMGEYSIDRYINGQMVSMPSIVPTLSKAELTTILNLKEGEPIPANIEQKAIDYARYRLSIGKSPFALPGEQSNAYPDLPRLPVPAARMPSGDYALPNESGQIDPRLASGSLGYDTRGR